MTDDQQRFQELLADERTVQMAKVIMAAYDELSGFSPRDWDGDDGRVSDYSRAKFLEAADAAFDKIEWTRFILGGT